MSKLIVLDLDGTLLRNDKTVSNETINVLLKFKEANNKILFATARPPRDAYKYVPEILRNNPIICYNGACMIDNQELVYKKELSKKDTLEITEIAEKWGYNQICIEINDKLYSNFDTSEFFGNALNQKVNLAEMNFEKAYKVIICSKKTISQNFVNSLPNSCKGVITDRGELCQIMNREASKWTSTKQLSEKLGMSIDDIIAFGDDYNDLEMIKNAGIGIAMGNAEESVKKVADFVTNTNMNDGIANYIKENILVI